MTAHSERERVAVSYTCTTPVTHRHFKWRKWETHCSCFKLAKKKPLGWISIMIHRASLSEIVECFYPLQFPYYQNTSCLSWLIISSYAACCITLYVILNECCAKRIAKGPLQRECRWCHCALKTLPKAITLTSDRTTKAIVYNGSAMEC